MEPSSSGALWGALFLGIAVIIGVSIAVYLGLTRDSDPRGFVAKLKSKNAPVDRRQDPGPTPGRIDPGWDPDAGTPEERAPRPAFTDLNQLPERWVVPQQIVVLDWTAARNDPTVEQVRDCLVAMNRRIYDATDGQIRIAKFVVLDRDRGAGVTAPGVMTFHKNWATATETHTENFDAGLIGFAHNLGSPAAPAHMHVGHEFIRNYGVEVYGAVICHEWLHAWTGVGDEYKDARYERETRCPADEAVRRDRDSCIMAWSMSYTELCRPDDHNTNTWSQARIGRDCYTHLVRTVNACVADRAGDLVVPDRVYAGPTDAPEPEIEIQTGRGAAPTRPASISAAFERVWVDHNVVQDGVTGMTIHTTFSVKGMKDGAGQMSVHFYDKAGKPLRDANQRYATTDGGIAVATPFRPGYDDTRYEDLAVFMPSDELHLGFGRFDLQLKARLWDAGAAVWVPLADSESQSFWYERKGQVTASIDDVAVEYDVQDAAGQYGMRIKASFLVGGLNGGQGFASAVFAFADGTVVRDLDGGYTTPDGRAATGAYFFPVYDSARFEAFEIFMPYDQLHLKHGMKHALTFRVELLAEEAGQWKTVTTTTDRPFSVDYTRQ